MLFDEVIKYVQQGNIKFWNVKKTCSRNAGRNYSRQPMTESQLKAADSDFGNEKQNIKKTDGELTGIVLKSSKRKKKQYKV